MFGEVRLIFDNTPRGILFTVLQTGYCVKLLSGLTQADEDLEAHEDFIGLYKVESIAANELVTVIKDVLLRNNLSINFCRGRGQCYDGARNIWVVEILG